jgi:hypothetical protein
VREHNMIRIHKVKERMKGKIIIHDDLRSVAESEPVDSLI